MFRFKQEPENRDDPRIAPKLRPVRSEDEEQAQKPLFWWVVLLLGAGFLIYHLISGDQASPTVINEDGEEVLSPERQGKLDRELDEFDNAVQYALFATVDGYYPCYTCPDGSVTIFLYEGEVWRYGSTRKGKEGRYPNENYGASNLFYAEQFWGNEMECRKMEKVKIYKYPLLPEALKRGIKLLRPPGNKNDN